MGDRSHILLAVSGGVDSMTMADKQFELCGGDSFSIAHCNFCLRAEESDSDEALVREWARQRNIEFFSIHFNTLNIASMTGESVEMAARRLRYQWFAELCMEHGFSEVHVAHNACDNAETLLLNLTRGTGIRGITGMRRRCPLEGVAGMDCTLPDGSRVQLVRPLLELSRSDIEHYAAANSVPFHTDRTNADTAYHRNAIRHKVLPALQEINPSVVRTLGEDMRHFAQASEVLDGFVAEVRPRLLDGDGNIIVSMLKNVPSWRYVLYRLLEEHHVSPAAVRDIELLINDKNRTFSGKTFDGGLVRTARDRIVFEDSECCLPALPELEMRTVPYETGLQLIRPKGEIVCDSAALPENGVCLRFWRHGDRMTPLGMKGSRLLSDIFSDRHISAREKSRIAVLVSADDDMSRVLAIPSLGIIDSKIKVTPETSGVTIISIRK